MKMMGTLMRRWIGSISLFVLILALSWHALLSFCIREAARWSASANLSFKEIAIEKGAIVLKDVHLSKDSYLEIFAKSAAIHLSFKKPISVQLASPHVVFSDGILSQLFKKGGEGSRIAVEIVDGTYEIGGVNPLSGALSYRDRTLFVDALGGSLALTASGSGDEKRMECRFDQFPLAPLSHLLDFLDCRPVDGQLSGFLHVSLDKTMGRLSLENAGWMSNEWSAAGGVGRLQIEGEADIGLRGGPLDLKCLRRIKAGFTDFCAVRNQSRIESLSGELFYNEGIGFRWELDGVGFSWHGKSFFKQCGAEWLQSRLEVAKAICSLDMERASEGRLWTLSLDSADAPFFQWISDFGPKINWPCQVREGDFQAALQCKESAGRIVEWSVSRFEGKKMALSSKDWNFACSYLSVNGACKENERLSFDGSMKLEAGRFTLKEIAIHDLQADLAISKGEIQGGKAKGTSGGLESTAVFSGSLQEILAEIQVRGPWSDFVSLAGFDVQGSDPTEANVLLKGDWRAFSSSMTISFSEKERLFASAFIDGFAIRNASLEASRFDLSRLHPSWAGAADLAVSYADGKWNAQGLGDDLFLKWKDAFIWIGALKAEGVYEKGCLSGAAEKTEGEIALLGEAIPFQAAFSLEDRLLSAHLDGADFAGIDFAGEWLFSLEEGIPFCFEATRMQGDLSGAAELLGFDLTGEIESSSFSLFGKSLTEPMSWDWSLTAKLSEIATGALEGLQASISLDSSVGLLSTNLNGAVCIGKEKFPVRGFAECQEDGWIFDVRVEDRYRDLARLAGSADKKDARICFSFDPQKSHLLGSSVQVRECKIGNERLEALKLAASVSFRDLFSWKRSLQAIDERLDSFLDAPVEGALAIEVDLRANALSLMRIEGEGLKWKGSEIPFHLAFLQNKESWKIEELQIGGLKGEASFSKLEDGWRIEEGVFRLSGGAEAAVNGFVNLNECELTVESLFARLQDLGLGNVAGEVRGKGSARLEWARDFRYETDLDLTVSPVLFEGFCLENAKPLQLHFSKRQGLLVRGVDLHVRDQTRNSSFYGRIGLTQYDFKEGIWHLHHAHLRLPTDSFSFFSQKLDPAHPLVGILSSFDPRHDLECFAEISFAQDFSHLTCSMKEGFIPFFGAVRHLQNVDFRYGGNEASVDFLALHQGHSLKIGAAVEIDRLSGLLTLEDEGLPLEAGQRAMALQWEIDPQKGLLIHSIEGVFGGVEASFHEEVCEKGSSLIGSAKVDFGYLSGIVSPRIGRVFQELKMGMGYELKGRFFYGPDWSEARFKGLLSGKNCELCGWQIRSLLSQVEIGSSLVRLFELKGSDAAGILKIDELTMSQEESNPWKIAMPSFKLLEFRPSLLQRIGREVGPVGPFVVRELEMKNFQGELEESVTYTAQGSLSFINSFKREHTVFDIPADVLGRIFGLDLELLIPVKGNLTFDLKEGKFRLDELQGAYSEGKR